MGTDAHSYLAVLKASYDYAPQSDDEIAIREDQLLLLVERTDDECVPRAIHPPLHLLRHRSFCRSFLARSLLVVDRIALSPFRLGGLLRIARSATHRRPA